MYLPNISWCLHATFETFRKFIFFTSWLQSANMSMSSFAVLMSAGTLCWTWRWLHSIFLAFDCCSQISQDTEARNIARVYSPHFEPQSTCTFLKTVARRQNTNLFWSRSRQMQQSWQNQALSWLTHWPEQWNSRQIRFLWFCFGDSWH